MVEDVLALGIPFSVTTNATILPPDDLLRRIISSQSVIMISVDGVKEETIVSIRQGLNYKVFLRNIEHIGRLVREINNPEFIYRINFVITRSNVEEMEDVVELAREIGVSSIFFSSFMAAGRSDDFAKESLFEEPETVRPYLERAMAKAEKYGIHIVPPVFKQKSVGQGNGGSSRIKQCPHPWRSVYIDADGSILPCCVFGESFGNIMDKGFYWQVWNGKKYRELRRTVNTPRMPPPCQYCPLNVRI